MTKPATTPLLDPDELFDRALRASLRGCEYSDDGNTITLLGARGPLATYRAVRQGSRVVVRRVPEAA